MPGVRGQLRRRITAAALDLTVVAAPVVALAWVLRTQVPDGAGWAGTALRWSLPNVVLVAASGLLWLVAVLALLPALTGDRTPGMRLTGLVVLNDRGLPADTLHHLVRALAVPVDVLPVVVPGLVGLVSILVDVDRRRVGDRWAGTVVVATPTLRPAHSRPAGPVRSAPFVDGGGRPEAGNGPLMAALLAELQDPPPITLDLPDDAPPLSRPDRGPTPDDGGRDRHDIRIRPPLPPSMRAVTPQGDLPLSKPRPSAGPPSPPDPFETPRPPRVVPSSGRRAAPPERAPRSPKPAARLPDQLSPSRPAASRHAGPAPDPDPESRPEATPRPVTSPRPEATPPEPAGPGRSQPAPPVTGSSHLVRPAGADRAPGPGTGRGPDGRADGTGDRIRPTWDEAAGTWVVRHPRTGRRYRYDRTTSTWVPDGPHP